MSTEQKRKNAGMGLCLLVALAAIGLTVKVSLDPSQTNFSLGPTAVDALPAGDPAPEFALQDLEGKEVSLADQKGQVVLVDFWATWCGPCVQELPHIQAIHQKYRDQGLIVLAVSTDIQKDIVQPFISKNKYTFPVLHADSEIQSNYGVSGIPTVYIIDRQGSIRFHHVGYGPGGEKQLEKEVEQLLVEKTLAASTPQG